jgi:NTE family protein
MILPAGPRYARRALANAAAMSDLRHPRVARHLLCACLVASGLVAAPVPGAAGASPAVMTASPVVSAAAGAVAAAALAPVAATASAPPGPARPRIGLALSGGGARGFAHVGVLRVLERLRVPVDCVAGTSAGAAVGAAYAAGLSPDEIEARLRNVDWNDIFDDDVARPDQLHRRKQGERLSPFGLTFGIDRSGLRTGPGLSAGHKVELLLHDLLGVSRDLPSFDALALPYRAVATDLVRGEIVVLERGSLVRAVRASMSVPSGFAPVREDGRLLVDGGLTRNLPVDVVRRLCADIVIAVDVGSPLLREDELQSLLGVAAQMVNILIEDNVRRSHAELGPADVLVAPDLGAVGAVDFRRGLEGIPAGERAAVLREPQLRTLSIAEEAWQAHLAARRAWRPPHERVDEVRVGGLRHVNPVVVEAQMRHPRDGAPLDRERLRRDIDRLMARGDFAQVNYRLLDEPGAAVLAVQPEERATGPGYLRLGLGAAVDSRANTYFNLPVAYSRTWVNALGAEWTSLAQIGRTSRLGTQFFQPLAPDGRLYVLPRLSYERRPLSLFLGDARVADFAMRHERVELNVGSQGSIADVRVGLVHGRVVASSVVGLPFSLEEDYRHSGVSARVSLDRLDAIDFPRSGWAFESAAYAARPVLGGQRHYNRLETQAQWARSVGPHTFSGLLRVGSGLGGDLPVAEAYTLGGFLNLSGFQINELLGSSTQFGRLMYYHQVMPLPRPFGTGLYVGTSLEIGRMQRPYFPWADGRWLTGGSVFVGANTGLGPVYLGLGLGEGGRNALYLYLGRP